MERMAVVVLTDAPGAIGALEYKGRTVQAETIAIAATTPSTAMPREKETGNFRD
jgi:hypothetical protein